jgi:hypothetical protein
MHFIAPDSYYYMRSILIGLVAFLISSSLMTSYTLQIQAFTQNKTIASIEQPEPTGSESGVIMIIVAAIILSGVALWELARRRRKQQGLKRRRQYFTELTKKQVLHNQHFSCAICKKKSEVWDYDHIDGDRSNNDLYNCQALCPNCHAKKTRGLIIIKQQKAKFSLVTWQIAIRVLVSMLLFFIILGTIMYYFVNNIH